jgi:hypothetical protein
MPQRHDDREGRSLRYARRSGSDLVMGQASVATSRRLATASAVVAAVLEGIYGAPAVIWSSVLCHHCR